MGFAGNAFKVGQIAGLAHQQSQLRAVGGKRPRHVMADKSCCAGKKDFHKERSKIRTSLRHATEGRGQDSAQ